MQANPSGGYQPSRPNPFDDRGPSDSYDSASKANSSTNLTAGASMSGGAGDAMSAFYSEVSAWHSYEQANAYLGTTDLLYSR